MRENEDIEDLRLWLLFLAACDTLVYEIFMSISIRLETKVEELGDFSRFERILSNN